jgi:hypothetical protein
MGYTHYWRNPKGFTDEQWNKLLLEVRKILKFSKIPIANGVGDEHSEPEVNNKRIFFNGVGDDSCETFNLTKTGQDFEFCKTRLLPYDDVVVLVLIEAKKVNPNIQLTSDGGPEVFE